MLQISMISCFSFQYVVFRMCCSRCSQFVFIESTSTISFCFYPHSKWNGFNVNSIELVLGLAIERLDDYVI